MGENSEREAVPPRGGAPSAMLLDGYDSIAGELRSSALAPSGPPDEGGTETYAHIAVCKGMTELTQALKVDQSLAIEFGEIGKIDEKVAFSREQKATTESVSIVVMARHRSKQLTAKNPKFKDGIDWAKLREFVAAHGDSYVESIALGGEYYGVYTFHTQTSEEQRDLVFALDGKGVKGGTSVDAKVVAEIHEFARNSKTASTFDQRLSGVNAKLPTQDEMVDFVINFSTKDFSHPVVIDRSIAHYENVSGFPPGDPFAPVRENRDYFVGSGDGALARLLVKIAARRNKVEWIQGIHACYGYSGDTVLAQLRKDLDSDREAIRAQLLDYRGNPLKKFTPPPLPSLAKGTPVLQFEPGRSPHWGNTHDEIVNFPSVEQALQLRTRLVSVQLVASDYADKITMVYRDIHGEGERHIGGWGGGGTPQNTIPLNSNEFVKRVNVRHGDKIDWLEIVTTSGASTHAGGSGGKSDKFEAENGHVVLGFQGSGGVDINSLQVVSAKLLPSTYVT